jgi:hypothetical protein
MLPYLKNKLYRSKDEKIILDCPAGLISVLTREKDREIMHKKRRQHDHGGRDELMWPQV